MTDISDGEMAVDSDSITEMLVDTTDVNQSRIENMVGLLNTDCEIYIDIVHVVLFMLYRWWKSFNLWQLWSWNLYREVFDKGTLWDFDTW